MLDSKRPTEATPDRGEKTGKKLLEDTRHDAPRLTKAPEHSSAISTKELQQFDFGTAKDLYGKPSHTTPAGQAESKLDPVARSLDKLTATDKQLKTVELLDSLRFNPFSGPSLLVHETQKQVATDKAILFKQLSILNSKDLKQANQESLAATGKTLADRLATSQSLTLRDKEVVEGLLKGSDYRRAHPEEGLKLANRALDSKDPELLAIALNGSQKTRELFAKDGLDKISKAFADKNQQKIARDVATRGEVQANTLVSLSEGYFWNDKDQTRAALKSISPEQRATLQEGRKLQESAVDPVTLSERQKQSLTAYNGLDQALKKNYSKDDVAELKAQALYGDGNLISRINNLATNRHFTYEGQNEEQVFNALSNISPTDVAMLKADPEYSQDLNKAVENKLVAASPEFQPKTLEKANEIVARKLRGETQELSPLEQIQKARREEESLPKFAQRIEDYLHSQDGLLERINNPKTEEDRKEKDRLYEEIGRIAISKAQSYAYPSAKSKEFFEKLAKPLLEDNGRLSIEQKLALTDRPFESFELLAHASPKEKETLLNLESKDSDDNRLQVEVFSKFKNVDERFHVDNVLKEGFTELNQLRALSLSDKELNGAEVARLKQLLSEPEKTDQLKEQYANKFHSSLDDVLTKVNSTERASLMALLRGTKQTTASALDTIAYERRKSESGVLGDVGYLEKSLAQIETEKLRKAEDQVSSQFEQLPAKTRVELSSDALDSYKAWQERKQDTAERITNGAIVVGSLALTGGLGTSGLVAAGIIAGGTKVAATSALIGEQYDREAVLKDLGEAAIAAGTPVALTAALKVGRAISIEAGTLLRSKEGTASLLKQGAEESATNDISEALKRSVLDGSDMVKAEAIHEIALKYATEGNEQAVEESLRNAITEAGDNVVRRALNQKALNEREAVTEFQAQKTSNREEVAVFQPHEPLSTEAPRVTNAPVYSFGPDGIQVKKTAGWLVSERKIDESAIGPIKVRVIVDKVEDLQKLHETLIPLLEKDPRFIQLAREWKSVAPDGSVVKNALAQNGIFDDQAQKGFTLYATNKEDAFKLQKLLDEEIQKAALGLEKPAANNNVDTLLGQSNRVGITRDRFAKSEFVQTSPDGLVEKTYGARIDLEVVDKIRREFSLNAGQRLSDDRLRALEDSVGLKPNTLGYDTEGHLALRGVSRKTEPYTTNLEQDPDKVSVLYLTETDAVKDFGSMTDRPALYSLYRRYGIDPAFLTSLE